MKSVLALASVLVIGYAMPSFAGGAGGNPDPTISDLATCTAVANPHNDSNIAKAYLYTVTENRWGKMLPPNTAIKLELKDGSMVYLPIAEGQAIDLGSLKPVYLDIRSTIVVKTTTGTFNADGKSYLNITRDNAADQNELTIYGNFEQAQVVPFSGTLKCAAK